jgi:hypothetical protein
VRGSVGTQNVALAHQHEADVTERGKVAAGADASLLRNQRQHPSIEQGNQRVYQLGPNPTGGTQQDVGAKQHDGTYHRCGQRGSDTRGVTANQIGLELIELVGGDPNVG